MYTIYMHTLNCTHFSATMRDILILRSRYFRSPCYHEYIVDILFLWPLNIDRILNKWEKLYAVVYSRAP